MATEFDAVFGASAASAEPVTHVPGLDLQELATRLILVSESTADLIGLTDGQGRVVYLNPAARKLLGVGPAAVGDLTIDALFPASSFGRYYDEIRPMLLRGEPWSGELVMCDATGATFRVRQTVVGKTNAGGEVEWLATIGHCLDEPRPTGSAAGGGVTSAIETPVEMSPALPGLLDHEDAELAHELAVGIGHNAIAPQYQPMIEIATGLVSGVEVFARWLHTRRGLLDAADFIDVANRTGLIVPLGFHVFREACAQASRWERSANGNGNGPRIHVNTSVRQLVDPGFVTLVSELLLDVGLAADRVCVEVPAGPVAADEEALTTLGQLRDRGIRLAVEIDETGTVPEAVRSLPIDAYKLDRDLVAAIGRDDRHDEVERLIDLAHGLGVVVIASGVEMSGQLAELRALDCDYAQGLFFSRPRRAEGVELLLGRRFVG